MPSNRDHSLHLALTARYQEIMWLARRDGITPADARAWYTHVTAGKFTRRIRQFSGKVSARAVKDRNAILRLEHQGRIQHALTTLVERHLKRKRAGPREFIRLVLRLETVHIVTLSENYAAMRNDGNYRRAGIRLLGWRFMPESRQRALWSRMLRGRVANAAKYAPR